MVAFYSSMESFKTYCASVSPCSAPSTLPSDPSRVASSADATVDGGTAADAPWCWCCLWRLSTDVSIQSHLFHQNHPKMLHRQRKRIVAPPDVHSSSDR